MTLTEVILAVLEVGAQTSAGLLTALVNIMEGGTTIPNLYRMKERGELSSSPTFHFVDSYRERQKVFALLNKLKREGFIKKRMTKKGSILWDVAGRGLKKLKKTREEYSIARFREEVDDVLRVISFDVPEKERKKRAWLRLMLSLMGFSMIQQSVWIGKKKIPEEFLNELHGKKMMGCIHIFSVGASGTLEVAGVKK